MRIDGNLIRHDACLARRVLRAGEPTGVQLLDGWCSAATTGSRSKTSAGCVLQLLYGTGMRLCEGLRLRVKDVDFSYNQVTVRDGKGFKDRVTMLPGRPGEWQEPGVRIATVPDIPHPTQSQSCYATAR